MELSPKHPFFSANDFFRERVGGKLIKLTVDGGFTCPNRDGTLLTKGCIFCSAKGSGDFAPDRDVDIKNQIEIMKEKMRAKWGEGRMYMAYFQAFTNTYAPIEVLREKFTTALACEGVAAISIATRPDCVNEQVCKLLEEIAQNSYVCVELGLQTANDKVGELINRCYKTEVYKNAVEMLKRRGIDVITHIILGLPTETKADMQETVNYAVKCGTDGIKLQLLHILEGTELAKMYRQKPFHIFTYEEYVNFVVDIIERVPKSVSIHRITGDGSKALLIEPWWSLDKRRVLNGISREFIKRGTCQGCKT